MSKSSLDFLDHWKLFSAKLQATNRAASSPWAFRAGPPSGKINTCLEYIHRSCLFLSIGALFYSLYLILKNWLPLNDYCCLNILFNLIDNVKDCSLLKCITFQINTDIRMGELLKLAY